MKMNKEDREWLEQLIAENKGSDNELLYTYCPFSVLYALQQENNQLKEQIQELRSWLESWIENEEYCYLATTPKDRCRKDVYQDVLSKLNKLEGKND